MRQLTERQKELKAARAKRYRVNNRETYNAACANYYRTHRAERGVVSRDERRAARIELGRKIAPLRLAGVSWVGIASLFGVGHSQCWLAFHEAQRQEQGE